MTFCKRLSKDGYNAIYKPLANLARKEHNKVHHKSIATANSPVQKEEIEGQYIGPWQRLLKGWMEGKVCNLRARRCLITGHVIKDTEGVVFVPTYSDQSA